MVLDYLSGAGDNDAIPLNNLAGKACMLIMLSTMCRMGDAFQLDTKEMARTEEYISFRLSHPTKTFTDNNCDFGAMGLQTLVLRKFHDPKLCPMQAVVDYIRRTEGVRGSISKLFLVVGPHVKAASSQSVTRWTKQILINAGLGQFTVHSSRSASASCALLLGLPIDSIINQAGWKSQSTFVKNYMKRPMQGLSDKHKFSVTWGSERGERLHSLSAIRMRRFLDQNTNSVVNSSNSQRRSATTSISGTSASPCASACIQTQTDSLPTSSPVRNITPDKDSLVVCQGSAVQTSRKPHLSVKKQPLTKPRDKRVHNQALHVRHKQLAQPSKENSRKNGNRGRNMSACNEKSPRMTSNGRGPVVKRMMKKSGRSGEGLTSSTSLPASTKVTQNIAASVSVDGNARSGSCSEITSKTKDRGLLLRLRDGPRCHGIFCGPPCKRVVPRFRPG